MPSAAFLQQQRPRRYDYLIEELVAAGGVLTVADLIADLDRRKRRLLRAWRSPTHGFHLVAARAGAARRWWVRCPGCRRRCEALYRPPGSDPAAWSCRICAAVQYGSRRHG